MCKAISWHGYKEINEKCSLWKPQKLQKQRTDTFRDICSVMVPVRAPSIPQGLQQWFLALAVQENHRYLEKVWMPESHLWRF